jgi:hypothetical protein
MAYGYVRTLSDLTNPRILEVTHQTLMNNNAERHREALQIPSSRRLDEGSDQIPFTSNDLDSNIIQDFNENPDFSDFRHGILLNIVENRCDPSMASFIIRNSGMRYMERINMVLDLNLSMSNYNGLLNLIVLGLLGDPIPEVRAIVGDIQSIMNGINNDNVSVDISNNLQNIRQETHDNLDRRIEESRREIDRIHEEGNRIRAGIFGMSLRTLATRSVYLVGTVGAAYLGMPYLNTVISMAGGRVLPTSMDSDITRNLGNFIRLGNEPTFNDVNRSFDRSWGLFFRWLGWRA